MKLNGQIFKLDEPIVLKTFLEQNRYDVLKIAVELNGAIIPRVAYADITLRDEDSLEVVSFVGGG